MELRFLFFFFFFFFSRALPLVHLFFVIYFSPDQIDRYIYPPRQSSLMTLTLILATSITILMNQPFSSVEPLLLISKRRDSNLGFEFRNFLCVIDALHHIELSIIFTACVCTLEATQDRFTRTSADAFVGSSCTPSSYLSHCIRYSTYLYLLDFVGVFRQHNVTFGISHPLGSSSP